MGQKGKGLSALQSINKILSKLNKILVTFKNWGKESVENVLKSLKIFFGVCIGIIIITQCLQRMITVQEFQFYLTVAFLYLIFCLIFDMAILLVQPVINKIKEYLKQKASSEVEYIRLDIY